MTQNADHVPQFDTATSAAMHTEEFLRAAVFMYHLEARCDMSNDHRTHSHATAYRASTVCTQITVATPLMRRSYMSAGPRHCLASSSAAASMEAGGQVASHKQPREEGTHTYDSARLLKDVNSFTIAPLVHITFMGTCESV